MGTTTVGAGTLRELSSFESDGHAVLSVYLDLDPSTFPTPAARDTELSALLSHAGAHDADAEQIRELLDAHPELTRGAHALAIFSCAQAGALEAVSLPAHVDPMSVVDTIPWLEPLAALVTTENWGVIVASRRGARLFRGGPRSLVEFSSIDDDLHRRHAQGGWSQARYQRGIEQQVAEHVRHTAELMLRAHRRCPFEHVVVVAADELWPEVEATLDHELRDRLAGQVALDLEHASAEEIVDAVAPVVERAQRDRERDLMASLEDALGTGGPAAAGLEEVLAMLEQERVETLLVAAGASLTAWLCARCGRLSAAGQNHCPLEGAPLAAVDAVEHMVELAAHESVEIVVIRHELVALRRHDSIAALLRW
jgi:peptide chain release factor subunit 1